MWSGTYCEGADDENMNRSFVLMKLSVNHRNILGSLCFFMHPPLVCIVPERIKGGLGEKTMGKDEIER